MVDTQKSQFLRELKKQEASLAAEAKKSVGGGFIEDEEVLKMFGITKVTDKVQVRTRLSRVSYGINKSKEPFFRFGWTVLDGPNAGTPLSNYYGVGGSNAEQKERNARDLAGVFQRHDVDTTKWTKAKLTANYVEASEALTEKRPGVMLQLGAYKAKTGQHKGKLRLKINIIGMFDAETFSANGAPSAEGGTDLRAIAEAADEEGAEECPEVDAAAEEAGIDSSQYETWVEVVDELESGADETTAPEEEAAEEEASEEAGGDAPENAEEYVGYPCTIRDIEGECDCTGYDADTGMFTLTDADGTEMEAEWGDLDFGGGYGVEVE